MPGLPVLPDIPKRLERPGIEDIRNWSRAAPLAASTIAENVKDLVQDIKREGGIVIGVGIGVYGADEDNRRLYQDFIDCKDPSELPTKMASLLRKLTQRGIIGQ